MVENVPEGIDTKVVPVLVRETFFIFRKLLIHVIESIHKRFIFVVFMMLDKCLFRHLEQHLQLFSLHLLLDVVFQSIKRLLVNRVVLILGLHFVRRRGFEGQFHAGGQVGLERSDA